MQFDRILHTLAQEWQIGFNLRANFLQCQFQGQTIFGLFNLILQNTK